MTARFQILTLLPLAFAIAGACAAQSPQPLSVQPAPAASESAAARPAAPPAPVSSSPAIPPSAAANAPNVPAIASSAAAPAPSSSTPIASASAPPRPRAAPQQLATGDGAVGPLVADTSAAYFLSGKCLHRIDLATHQVSSLHCFALAGHDAGSLALDASHLYFTRTTAVLDESAPVFRIPKTGGTPTRVVVAKPSPESLVVDGSNLIWTGIGGVHKAPVSGGAATSIATYGGGADGLQIAGNNLVFSAMANTDAGVWVIPRSGGAPVRRGQSHLLGLSVDGSQAYGYTTHDRILRVDLTTGAETTVGSPQGRVRSLALDGSTIVFGTSECTRESMAGSVQGMPKDGGRAIPIASMPCPKSMVATQGVLYVVSTESWDCTELEAYARRAKAQGVFAVLGVCNPGKWVLRRIA